MQLHTLDWIIAFLSVAICFVPALSEEKRGHKTDGDRQEGDDPVECVKLHRNYEFTIARNNEPVMIGFNSEDRQARFNGWIDDVRLYGYGLSEADVKALYHGARYLERRYQ